MAQALLPEAQVIGLPDTAHTSNVLRFPVVPRKTVYNQSHGNSVALRGRLKDIIDTAYDGLLNQREAEALARIDELLMLSGPEA